jgi:hypothetical protein
VIDFYLLLAIGQCSWAWLSDTDDLFSFIQDTFVVGCKFSDKIIYPETFEGNPDYHDPIYSTEYGVYKPHCGLENVMLSWGHDEYLYHVLKDQCSLPQEGLAMIRYHSCKILHLFTPAHLALASSTLHFIYRSNSQQTVVSL